MVRNNILYLLLLAGLFYGFISLLDNNKARAENLVDNVSYDVLKYQWVVAEAKDLSSGKDLTDGYSSVVFQFLSSGGFVEFEDKIIRNTGTWRIQNNKLIISYDDESSEDYKIEIPRPEEMILQNGMLQMHLLRLQL
jgi:hypothetical protein